MCVLLTVKSATFANQIFYNSNHWSRVFHLRANDIQSKVLFISCIKYETLRWYFQSLDFKFKIQIPPWRDYNLLQSTMITAMVYKVDLISR